MFSGNMRLSNYCRREKNRKHMTDFFLDALRKLTVTAIKRKKETNWFFSFLSPPASLLQKSRKHRLLLKFQGWTARRCHSKLSLVCLRTLKYWSTQWESNSLAVVDSFICYRRHPNSSDASSCPVKGTASSIVLVSKGKCEECVPLNI